MAAYRVNLAALKNNGGSASATVDLGKTRSFLAWGSVTMVDSLSDFDDDNAYAFDIFTIDGVKTPTAVYGGAHWGRSAPAPTCIRALGSAPADISTCGCARSTPPISIHTGWAAS